MKLFILLFLFSLRAFAQDYATFFSKIEGDWNLEKEVTEITKPDGEVSSLSTITKFDATITRETYGWSLWEEYCVVENGQEACGDFWAIYQIIDDKLFLITESGKDEVNVIELTPSLLLFELGLSKSHTESLSKDSVLQKNISVDEDGTSYIQSLLLKRRSL